MSARICPGGRWVKVPHRRNRINPSPNRLGFFFPSSAARHPRRPRHPTAALAKPVKIPETHPLHIPFSDHRGTMASLSQLQARREALAKAIESGALSVKHGEKTITYRTLAEMKRIRGDLDAEIAALSGAKRKPKQHRVYTRMGL